MKRYLLDTNILIYLMTGRFRMDEKITRVGISRCSISEITVAELKYGVMKSEHPKRNGALLSELIPKFGLVSIYPALDVYAREKARLSKQGQIIDEFDLLIASCAVADGMVLVTNNTRHMERVHGVVLENWAVD